MLRLSRSDPTEKIQFQAVVDMAVARRTQNRLCPVKVAERRKSGGMVQHVFADIGLRLLKRNVSPLPSAFSIAPKGLKASGQSDKNRRVTNI
jgi:hypothetical protein